MKGVRCDTNNNNNKMKTVYEEEEIPSTFIELSLSNTICEVFGSPRKELTTNEPVLVVECNEERIYINEEEEEGTELDPLDISDTVNYSIDSITKPVVTKSQQSAKVVCGQKVRRGGLAIMTLIVGLIVIGYFVWIKEFGTEYSSGYKKNYDDAGIQALFKLLEGVKCKRKNGHCIPGTVQVDPWLDHALKTQYFLARNDPVNTVQFPATHNSFNARADGYGGEDNVLRQVLSHAVKDTDLVIAQQEYSMTDQLNFGIRMLHLDPQWFKNKLRMCHAGTKFNWFDKLVKVAEKISRKKFEYSSQQLGCTRSDRTWESGIKEIAKWVKGNPESVVFLYINNEPKWDWGHSSEVIDPILQTMDDLLFTPSQLTSFGESWPSMAELVNTNKRVVLVGSGAYAAMNNTHIHSPLWTGYPRKNMKKFLGWPLCTTNRNRRYNFTSDWNCVSGESQLLGPFYDGPSDMGLIQPSNIQELVDCGVKMVTLDQASPKLVQNMIWTWAENEPSNQFNCTKMRYEPDNQDINFKGTWYTHHCNTTLPVACEHNSIQGKWTVGHKARFPRAHRACPKNYHFSVPTNPYFAKRLRLEMEIEGIEYVWLNFDPLQSLKIIGPEVTTTAVPSNTNVLVNF